MTSVRSTLGLAKRQTLSIPPRPNSLKPKKNKRFAPAGNRTRVCTVAGYYSTTRPSNLCLFCRLNTHTKLLHLFCRPTFCETYSFPNGSLDGNKMEFMK